MKFINRIICVLIFTTNGYVAFGQVTNRSIDTTLAADTANSPPLYLLKIDNEFKIIADSLDHNFNAFSVIDLEWVKSIIIYKDESVTKKYGRKGKNGVIVIELYKKYFKNIPTHYCKEKLQLADTFYND